MKFFLAIVILSLGPFAKARIDPANIQLKTLIGWSSALPTGSQVKVAVIDSGIIPNFPGDLSLGWNFVQNTPDFTDKDGHGTATASVILSLAKDASVIPLKVADLGVAQQSHIVEAIVYAIKNQVEIINISIGFSGSVFAEVQKKVSAQEFGRTLFVLAAGNRNQQINGSLGDNMILVGATLLSYPISLTSYSNWGSGVEIAAPAGEVGDGITVMRSVNPIQYRYYNGTSAAAPVVSAAAVILKQRYPNSDSKKLKELLLNSSTEEVGLNHKVLNNRFLNLEKIFQ